MALSHSEPVSKPDLLVPSAHVDFPKYCMGTEGHPPVEHVWYGVISTEPKSYTVSIHRLGVPLAIHCSSALSHMDLAFNLEPWERAGWRYADCTSVLGGTILQSISFFLSSRATSVTWILPTPVALLKQCRELLEEVAPAGRDTVSCPQFAGPASTHPSKRL